MADLADYDVSAATLTDFQSKITAYGGVNGKPRSARSNSRAAGELLKTEFAAVDRLLDKQLDGLMAKFKSSNPPFYAAYVAARDVVNHPGGHKSKNGSNGNDTPSPQ